MFLLYQYGKLCIHRKLKFKKWRKLFVFKKPNLLGEKRLLIDKTVYIRIFLNELILWNMAGFPDLNFLKLRRSVAESSISRNFIY